MQKIVVLGASGNLGQVILSAFEKSGSFVKTPPKHLKRSNQSLSHILDWLQKIEVDIVVNCIAMTGLDSCALDKSAALEINGNFPNRLVTLSQKMGFRLVHFSTENVFPCENPDESHTEIDNPKPSTWYGKTKFIGESLSISENKINLIRLPLLLGKSHNQIIGKLTSKIKNGEVIQVSDDLYSTPISTVNVADFVISLTLHNAIDANTNIFHLCSEKSISLYDTMAEISRKLDIKNLVYPTSTKTFKSIEKKPLYGGLSSIYVQPYNFDHVLNTYLTTDNFNVNH